jgi:ATP-dependent Clp protease ATP-binding subunit ClpA
MTASTIGFTTPAAVSNAKNAIEKTFSPEFRNRLDAIVVFNPLDPVAIARVVEKNLAELRKQLEEKRVSIELSEAALGWLAEKGFDRLYGARPMARLIEQELKRRLADEVLFGRLQDGGKVSVDVKDGKLDLVVQSGA